MRIPTRRTPALILAGVLVLLAVLTVGIQQGRSIEAGRGAPQDPVSGRVAPYSAPPLEGDTIDAGRLERAALADRYVLVNFWASWCVPCQREIPILIAFADAHPDLAVVGINYQDSAAGRARFLAEQPIPWPSLPDEGPLREGFRLAGMPSTYLVSPRGLVVARLVGEATPEGLERAFGALVGPPAASD
jgi:cytochrome c biogenesis protein CcmG, thiol:disulfide interchange protein DsbE